MSPGVDCAAFASWLDDGRPVTGVEAAVAHSAVCRSCAEALAAERAIEALLREGHPVAPAGFAVRVMRAVEVANEARKWSPAPVWTDAMPWWARAAAQPPVIAAAALAALLMGRPDWVERGGRVTLAAVAAAWQAMAEWLVGAAGPAGAAIAADPVTQMQLAGMAALLLVVASGPLYRWSERLGARPAWSRGSNRRGSPFTG